MPDCLPLLPDEKGNGFGFRNHVTKQKVIESLRHMATDKVSLITGHTLRVIGARLLASKGIDLSLIMMMARWKSEAVL
eukprot:5193575-Amphidinium_carterae.1